MRRVATLIHGAAAAVLIGMVAAVAVNAQASDRPNILFIFADDWGWGDLSCHNHPYVKTPNIDRLAREGTDFHRFTVASGVCSPSRTAVMTGHFPARYNINGHFAAVEQNAARTMPDWLDVEAPLLPRILRQAGYVTAHYGKWHLANDMIPDAPLPSAYGYDDYGAFNCAGEQMPVHDDAARTIAFLEQAKAEGKSFFINLWIHEPHTPFHVLPRYRWRFREVGLAEPDEIYAATLAHADDRVGQVLDTLDRLGLTEDTLVIFSSDNGPARATGDTTLRLMHDTATGAGFGIAASKGITGGRKGYKAALFEGGIGVPFIARWPGTIPAGRVDDQTLISAVDLLPTFCDLAGADLPEGYAPDGVSQVNALLGQPSERRVKPLFWKTDAAWPAPKDRPDHWGSYAIVRDCWKLIANRDLSHTELYDLAADPLEKMDLADREQETAALLRGQLTEWRDSLPPAPTGSVFSATRTTTPKNVARASPAATTDSQDPLVSRWESDIADLEALDKASRDPEDAILFIGSSSIRLWDSIHEDMAPYPAVRRGYGGACYRDLRHFASRLVTAHQPRAIVIFVANDITSPETSPDPEQVMIDVRATQAQIRERHPEVPIFYVAVTPTESRWSVWPTVQRLNRMIEEMCRDASHSFFIPTARHFLDTTTGRPVPELFRDDRLHLSRAGYKVWASVIRAALDHALAPATAAPAEVSPRHESLAAVDGGPTRASHTYRRDPPLRRQPPRKGRSHRCR